MKSVASALLLTGVLSQTPPDVSDLLDFFSSDKLDGPDRKFTDTCKTNTNDYRSKFDNDLKKDRDDSFDCFTASIDTVFGSASTYERSRRDPCSRGVDKLEEFCEREDGTLCYFTAGFKATVIIDIATASVTAADCIPKVCTEGDLEEFNVLIDNSFGVNVNLGEAIDISADARVFCVAESENRRYRRNQKGRGRQTRVKLISDIELDVDIGKRGVKVDADLELKFRCNRCPRNWQVSIPVPKDVPSDDPRKAENIANYIATQLSADEDFQSSNCSSIYDVVDESLNIACPEAVEGQLIEVQEVVGNVTGEWTDVVDFVSQGAGITFEGEDFRLDDAAGDVVITPVRSTGDSNPSSSDAGSFAPMMASIAAAAFALAAAQL